MLIFDLVTIIIIQLIHQINDKILTVAIPLQPLKPTSVVTLHWILCSRAVFQTPIDFLERQSAGTQRLMSSFIVSDPSRLIRLQQDKDGKSGCNVAVILHMTRCSKATKLDKEDKTPVTRGRCTVTSDRIPRPTHCL